MLMPDNQWLEFLDNLMRNVSDDVEQDFSFGDTEVNITKLREETHGRAFFVDIKKGDLFGYYIFVEGLGAVEFGGSYPYLVEHPTPVASYSGDMTEGQRLEWGMSLANNVVQFLRDLWHDTDVPIGR